MQSSQILKSILGEATLWFF